MSRASIRAMEYAMTLQGLAIDHIKEQFSAEEDLDFNRGVSFEEFVKALAEADKNGQRDQFEQQLAERMGASWTALQQQIAAQAQQGQGPQNV
ncbi:MAG: hypothetical protein NUV34_05160 [Sulfuricaulis sp.]|nr:hypothetical protein [Sulfuricaulis sp.]